MQISLVALAALILFVGVVTRTSSQERSKSTFTENSNDQVIFDPAQEEIDDVIDSSNEGVLGEKEAPEVETLDNVFYESVLKIYIYPKSEVVTSTYQNLFLRSDDDPKIITDWYKDVIRADGFNVKNFVSTSTNGEVLNKLEAAGKDTEISVEITKSPNEKVEIKVNLTQ